MTGRTDLVAAATVGIAHRAVDLAALPEPLRPGEQAGGPAVALLDAAALAAVAGRTGPPPAVAPAVPTRPVAERLPVVPTVVRQVLDRVVGRPAILCEALDLVRRAGLRLPPDLVPGLLEDLRPGVAPATRPVAGEIGGLLMAANPRWAAPVDHDPADRTIWAEGTVSERTAWLRALRRIDPAASRDLLVDALSREAAGTRNELLRVLADGLSAADQDVLLAAVGDRSPTVVATAIDLLARLPRSPLSRDMHDLAARHLHVQRRLLRTSITLTDPTRAEFAPWPAPVGYAWTGLLDRIDPAQWQQVFGVDLLKLLAADPPELRLLAPGFRQAAVTFRHPGLARILVERQFAAADAKLPPVVDTALWGLLAPAPLIALLDRLLQDRRIRPDQIAGVVSVLHTPWSTAISRRFARWLPAAGPTAAPAPRPLWDQWAAAVALPDCRALADVARNIAAAPAGDHGPALAGRAGAAANLLTLRAVLYETLCSPGEDQ